MTDIHSHILFDVDDGSKSIDESIELLKKMEEIGFDNVILTPHFIENSDYLSLNEEKLNKLEELKKEIKRQKLKIKIYLGNEIFINQNIIEHIQKDEIYSMNNGKYLLIEFPFHNQILNIQDILYELKIKGYIPIIAHPERYIYFQKNYDLVKELKNEGILFQSNYSSILGDYGSSSKKLMKKMLKDKYIDYLGTDIHHINKSFVLDNFSKIQNKIIKIVGKDYYDKIILNCNNLLKK